MLRSTEVNGFVQENKGSDQKSRKNRWKFRLAKSSLFIYCSCFNIHIAEKNKARHVSKLFSGT